MSSIQKNPINLIKTYVSISYKNMLDQKSLLSRLSKSSIIYKLYQHPALFTVEDSVKNRGLIMGNHSKNLFLKNKKKQFFLFSCVEDRVVNLKKISKSLNLGNVSFASKENLINYLGVMPGSVTPFGLLNDMENKVKFYLDSQFLKEDFINFHPLNNTSTINLKTVDFMNFLSENKKKVNIFDFIDYSLIE